MGPVWCVWRGGDSEIDGPKCGPSHPPCVVCVTTPSPTLCGVCHNPVTHPVWCVFQPRHPPCVVCVTTPLPTLCGVCHNPVTHPVWCVSQPCHPPCVVCVTTPSPTLCDVCRNPVTHPVWCVSQPRDCLVGLVVKASTSRAGGPEFESR